MVCRLLISWLLLLQSTSFRAHEFHGFTSCGTRAQELWFSGSSAQVHGMCDPSGSGIEPVSPTLTGRFFTTEPQGKAKDLTIVEHFEDL